jgi:hypothetical protein
LQVVVVVFQEEVVVQVKIDLHMKVVIVVVVVNNEHNVLLNLKDNNQQMKQVDLNKLVMLGELTQQMIIINHLVVIVGVAEVVAEVVEIMKEVEAVEIMKEVEAVEIMKEVEVVEIMKEVEVVAEAVVVVDEVILITEVLKKVHSNNNNKHKKAVHGNKIPSM